jgi:predicted enzyme related to lactoylglutathione lyase
MEDLESLASKATVPQRISFVTIGVNDLSQMSAFYKNKFGWEPVKEEEGIVFFKANGIMFGLYSTKDLADDIGVPNEGVGFKKMTLAVNVSSVEAVDTIFSKMRERGVKIVKAPEEIFWGGYRGYIADIEDNYWEIVYNPFLVMEESGNVLDHL